MKTCFGFDGQPGHGHCSGDRRHAIAPVNDLGDELDIIYTIDVSPRSKLLLGWSHFRIGNKIQTLGRSDADFFYSQWHVNF